MTLTFIQGHRDSNRQKTFVKIFFQSCEWLGIEFGMLFRLAGVINLILIFSCLIYI